MPLLSRRRLLSIAGSFAVLGSLGMLFSRRNVYYSGPASDHFNGEIFVDPQGSPPKPFSDLLKWQFGGEDVKVPWPTERPSPVTYQRVERVAGPELHVTMIGHASFLLQVMGVNLLIDPVYSERASPVTFAGPKRVNPPGIPFEQLPPVDVVLVSHNHYDHLDLATLSRLAAEHRPRVLTPLGNDTIMAEHDKAIRAEAFDWGQRVEIGGGLAVNFVACRHWSARGMFDRNHALWAAFVIETPLGIVYHIADTGFGDGSHHRAMVARYGAPRLAILPIGAYEPRWFMKDQHINPQEAVQIFTETGAKEAIGHHWGTFQLTNEGIDAPPQALAEALAAARVERERFALLLPGESRVYS